MPWSKLLLLLLLIALSSLSGAWCTDYYYVRPTESTNTSCPGQPCLTLNQYNDQSDQYFKSHVIFRFLPGMHHLEKPVIFKSLQSVLLVKFCIICNKSPTLVPLFYTHGHPKAPAMGADHDYCKKAIICFHNVTWSRLNGIDIFSDKRTLSTAILIVQCYNMKISSCEMRHFTYAIEVTASSYNSSI